MQHEDHQEPSWLLRDKNKKHHLVVVVVVVVLPMFVLVLVVVVVVVIVVVIGRESITNCERIYIYIYIYLRGSFSISFRTIILPPHNNLPLCTSSFFYLLQHHHLPLLTSFSSLSVLG